MQDKALYHILKCLLLTTGQTTSRTKFSNDWMETGYNSVIFLSAI